MSPLPDSTENTMNIGAELDSQNGVAVFKSYTNGAFVVCVKIASYRDGVLLAEITREIETYVIPCDNLNLPPEIIAVGIDSSNIENLYIDTVTVGEIVEFDIIAQDTGHYSNLMPQLLNLYIQGNDFGYNYSDSLNGCLNPPCATLSQPYIYQSVSPAVMHFRWRTDYSHLINSDVQGNYAYKTHSFFAIANDNWCPIPAYRIGLFQITVKSDSLIYPDLKCVSADSSGNLILTWLPVVYDSTNNVTYSIYRSIDLQVFQEIDSNISVLQTQYIDTDVPVGSNQISYFIRNNYDMNNIYLSNPSMIISAIKPVLNQNANNKIIFNWNQPYTGYNAQYLVYRSENYMPLTFIDATTQTNFIDSTVLPFTNYRYIIAAPEGINCTSWSFPLDIMSSSGLNEEKDALSSISIFPNPIKNEIKIYLSNLNFDEFSIQINNVLGETLYFLSKVFPENGLIKLTNLNLGEGIYFITVHSEKHLITAKIIVCK